MNRKLSLIVAVALVVFVVLWLSVNGVIAREDIPQIVAGTQPRTSQCAVNAETARFRMVGQIFD